MRALWQAWRSGCPLRRPLWLLPLRILAVYVARLGDYLVRRWVE